MTRPDDIDPAIWEAAVDAMYASQDYVESYDGWNIGAAIPIARAMMAVQLAERSRCVSIVRAHCAGLLQDNLERAIRNHPTAPRNAE